MTTFFFQFDESDIIVCTIIITLNLTIIVFMINLTIILSHILIPELYQKPKSNCNANNDVNPSPNNNVNPQP